MLENFKLKKPFFEFGPKVYLYGDEVMEYAVHADMLAEKYPVDIIFTAQYTDIEKIAQKCKNIKVFAQHMDATEAGRGVGHVLPEAIKHIGAQGVLLNHAEKPMYLSELNGAIRRADKVGLATLVCAGDIYESMAVAALCPNIVLAESPELIGVGKRSADDAKEIKRINEAVFSINEKVEVLHGAGITDENDVYQIILAGSNGTGSTSGILKAKDPLLMFTNMIKAVTTAYKDRQHGN